MSRVYISAGSNQNREIHLSGGIDALRVEFGDLVLSPIYESPAVGFEGDPFLNLVIGFDTDVPPAELVERLRAIEAQQGRIRDGQRFRSRTLDLDLLLYDDQIMKKGRVQIPRDEILNYAFVLKPLVDIRPSGIHPQVGASFAALWETFRTRSPEQADSLVVVTPDLSPNS